MAFLFFVCVKVFVMNKNKHLRNFLISLCLLVSITLVIGIVLLVDSLNNDVSDKI